jgi:hypothetical protein
MLSCHEVSLGSKPQLVEHKPSMSTLLPMFFFHCFPALAMRRNRLSPSIERRLDGWRFRVVEFIALSADGGAPEKKACMLYISL